MRLEVLHLPFRDVPGFGPGGLVHRLEEGGWEDGGFPLFSPEGGPGWLWSGLVSRREALEEIERQNPGFPPLEEGTVFVLGGQQPGLLLGPMYTVLKAVSVVNAARALREAWRKPVEPLFWIASEDHDVLEVNRVVVEGKRFVWDFDGELRRGRVPPVGDISLDEAKGALLKFLDERLRETEFKPWVLGLVEETDFSNYRTAFEGLLKALFRKWGLRTVEPVGLRRLSGRVLAALVERFDALLEAFERGAEKLRREGFEPPLASLGLFEMVEGRRVPVETDGSRLKLSSGWMRPEDAAEEIRSRPGDFSPGAGLRPIVQDGTLPVAVTFGGPSELLYLWQVDPVYEAAGVRRSALYPRVSCTFVEEKIRSAAEKAGLWPDGVFRAGEILERMLETVEEPEVERVEAQAGELTDALRWLEKEAGMEWLPKRLKALEKSLEYIVRRLKESRLERRGLERKRLEKIAEAVRPGGKPQERSLNIFELLNRYGPGLMDAMLDSLEPFRMAHRLVSIRP